LILVFWLYWSFYTWLKQEEFFQTNFCKPCISNDREEWYYRLPGLKDLIDQLKKNIHLWLEFQNQSNQNFDWWISKALVLHLHQKSDDSNSRIGLGCYAQSVPLKALASFLWILRLSLNVIWILLYSLQSEQYQFMNFLKSLK